MVCPIQIWHSDTRGVSHAPNPSGWVPASPNFLGLPPTYTRLPPKAAKIATETQWLKWFCEAGGSTDEATLQQQTPYPFQPH